MILQNENTSSKSVLGINRALNKLKPVAKVRPREFQKLGAEFHELEHSKPLFNKKLIC